MLDSRALDVRVEVRDVDELRAALVGSRCDRADERRVLELARDGHDLARLDVGAVHGELCQGVVTGGSTAGDRTARPNIGT